MSGRPRPGDHSLRRPGKTPAGASGPHRGSGCPGLPSQSRRGRRSPTLTAKSHPSSRGPSGPASPWRGPTPRTGTRETPEAGGTGATPQPNSPATHARGPAPGTVKPTPTSWNTDDCHRTFRPMGRRHHSAWSSPSPRKHTSASGAPGRHSAGSPPLRVYTGCRWAGADL